MIQSHPKPMTRCKIHMLAVLGNPFNEFEYGSFCKTNGHYHQSLLFHCMAILAKFPILWGNCPWTWNIWWSPPLSWMDSSYRFVLAVSTICGVKWTRGSWISNLSTGDETFVQNTFEIQGQKWARAVRYLFQASTEDQESQNKTWEDVYDLCIFQTPSVTMAWPPTVLATSCSIPEFFQSSSSVWKKSPCRSTDIDAGDDPRRNGSSKTARATVRVSADIQSSREDLPACFAFGGHLGSRVETTNRNQRWRLEEELGDVHRAHYLGPL